MARTKKDLDAAFTPAGLAVCPTCFSRPSIVERQERMLNGTRGWSSTIEEAPLKVGKTLRRVAQTRYPCSNPTCPTVIVYRTLSGTVGQEAVAPFRKQQTLTAARTKHFERGVIGKDGVWRENGQAIEPPPPKVKKKSPAKPAVTKKARAVKKTAAPPKTAKPKKKVTPRKPASRGRTPTKRRA